MKPAAWRDYPELAAYSDAECTRLLFLARQRPHSPLPMIGLLLGAGMAGLVLTFALYILLRGRSGGYELFGVLLPFTAMIPISFGVHRTQVRRALREVLVTCPCPKCDFPLHGLPVADGRLRCPECGELTIAPDLREPAQR